MNSPRAFTLQLGRQLSRKPFWNDTHPVWLSGNGGCCAGSLISGQLLAKHYSVIVSSQLGNNFRLFKVKNDNKTPLIHREVLIRDFSSQVEGSSTEGETTLKKTIKKCFPNATNVNVEDISGGCGSMYQIYIEAPEFGGLTTVKQHRLVNEALKQEIKSMHGVRIQTAVPKKT